MKTAERLRSRNLSAMYKVILCLYYCIEKNSFTGSLIFKASSLIIVSRTLTENQFLYKEFNFMSLGLPVVIENDVEYRKKLEEIFQEYNTYIDEFVNKKEVRNILIYSEEEHLLSSWKDELTQIRDNEDEILSAIDDYRAGNIPDAQAKIFKLLDKLITGDDMNFLVSDIDRSYATRLNAPFQALHRPEIKCDKEYKHMNSAELCFFRGRVGRVESHKDMLHIPLNKRDCVKTQRFSVPGTPCLYLGTSSYNIWRELDRPSFSDFNVSMIRMKPVEERKEIRILNLTANIYFIYEIIGTETNNLINIETVKLLLEQLKIWPLICATSFKVKNSVGFFHSEYIVSHLIMMNLPKLKIDGIAYVSKRMEPQEEKSALPLMVNIALPVISVKGNGIYGDICSKIEITDPVNFQEFQGLDSGAEPLRQRCYFINTCRNNHKRDFYYAKRLTKYQNTSFFHLDDFLCNQVLYSYNVVKQKWSDEIEKEKS